MTRGIVAIVGRPNVGKSTLFNRLTGSFKAIIDDSPGVTRDRHYGLVSTNENEGEDFFIIDTGGFETEIDAELPKTNKPFLMENVVWEQTKYAIESADLVLMVFDAKAGLHQDDTKLVNYLNRAKKQVLFIANKVDGVEQEALSWEFYQLPLGDEDPKPVSALHRRGLEGLKATICARLKASISCHSKDQVRSAPLNSTKVALIGRPNVGKSSILNRMTGEARAIVSEVPGTTRDSIDATIHYNRAPYTIVDTAGIRRRSRINDKIESLSVVHSLTAIDKADIVIIVIAADQGLSDQDARLASLCASKYKPLLFVVNKWDLIPNKTSQSAYEYERDIKDKIKNISFVPMMFVSCLENQRVHRIMDQVERLRAIYQRRTPTAEVNRAFEKIVANHTPALMKSYNKRVKFYFATQTQTAPPTFVIMCNVADEIQTSYKRYIANQLRRDLEFPTVPLKIIFRSKNDGDSTTGKGRRGRGR